jgi:transposase
MDFIGIDLHKTSSQVCILSEDGELTERRIKSTRASFDEVFAARPQARILVEASTESEWVACHLEALGHEVIVADPNFAPMYATRDKKIKTDKRDARALCEACRLRAYRPAHRTSERQRQIRAQLLVRSTLVCTRSKYISLIGSLARREGCRIATGGSTNFIARVEAANLPTHVMAAIAPLFESLRMLNRQIDEADALLEKIVKEDEVVKRLCTAPGVGPVTATTFAATIDDASRFGAAKQVRSYLGLVPREYSSGERQHRGRISKAAAAAREHCSWRRHGRCFDGGRRRTKLFMIGRCGSRHDVGGRERASRWRENWPGYYLLCGGMRLSSTRRPSGKVMRQLRQPRRSPP